MYSKVCTLSIVFLVLHVHYALSMDNKPMALQDYFSGPKQGQSGVDGMLDINYAIKKQDFCAFLGVIAKADLRWLQEKSSVIQKLINEAKFNLIGVRLESVSFITLTETQKQWVEPFDFMLQGFELRKKQLQQEENNNNVRNAVCRYYPEMDDYNDCPPC